MGQKKRVLSYLEMMRESLEEALKETLSLRNEALEEEVLIEAEAITKTCNSTLKRARCVERIPTAPAFHPTYEIVVNNYRQADLNLTNGSGLKTL